jgi:hypothetical protein
MSIFRPRTGTRVTRMPVLIAAVAATSVFALSDARPAVLARWPRTTSR